MISESEHLFTYLLVIGMSSSEKCLVKSFLFSFFSFYFSFFCGTELWSQGLSSTWPPVPQPFDTVSCLCQGQPQTAVLLPLPSK
jgi:hypothetical protein